MLNGWKDLRPFKAWCIQILPSIFDESMSYYEVLCKMIKLLNDTMNNVDLLHEAYNNFTDNVNTSIEDFKNAINTKVQELENYMANYFNNLDVQEEINNKINELISSGEFQTLITPIVTSLAMPVFVDNIAAMVNKNKTYVLKTNKHIYTWNGSSFIDTGSIYGNLANVIVGHGSINGFTDFNALPPNTIYTFTNVNGLSNAPFTNGGGTVLTANYSESNDGKFQLVIGQAAQYYVRLYWAGGWLSWARLSNDNRMSFIDGLTFSSITDSNTLKANNIAIVNNPNNGTNKPYDTFQGMIVTYGFSVNSTDILCQLAINATGNGFYWRIKWGANPTWGEWKQATLYTQLEDAIAKIPFITGNVYNTIDLNTLRGNNFYAVYGTATNAPEENFTGFICSFSTVNPKDTNIDFQLAFGRDNEVYWRIAWGPSYNWGGWRKLVNKQTITDYNGGFSVFEKVGIIGDSFASGEIYVNNIKQDVFSLSWGQNIARTNGIKVYNFSKGGMTTRSWLVDSEKGLPSLKETEACNLYIIALGLNDKDFLTDSYLGSINDVTSNWESNPNSFYGNYGKIIGNIQVKAPKAKIVLSTLPVINDYYSNFSQAVINIGNKLSLPVIKCSNDAYFTSRYYTNKVNAHPVAVTYAGMAKAYERLLSRLYEDNFNYFKDYIT